MHRLLLIPLCLVIVLPACRQMRQAGQGIATGTGAVGRPVVSGTKKIASATASGTRYLADATVSGSKKVAKATVSGAKALASGASRLITFGSAQSKPAPPPLAAKKPDQGPAFPATYTFPRTGLLVTDAELGPDATRLQATAVHLAGGWTLNGNDLAYRLPPGADDPAALRIKGSPANAVLKSGSESDAGSPTTATAREIHYHSANQVLTLRGNPVLESSGTKITATASQTQIHIHLPSGAIEVEGPARWAE
jgi:hypothetical protein